jgi:large subunit ribosomal protein L32
MPNPAFRQSHGRSRRRRAHQALPTVRGVTCPNCGEVKLPHRACGHCGYVRPGLSVRMPSKSES